MNAVVSEIPQIPVRMLNEFVYCPRLAYLEWVQGEFRHSADTVDGAIKHRRVDKGGGSLPEKPDDQERIHARSVSLGSEKLGITAKIDVVEGNGQTVTPVDYKRGKRPHIAGGVYAPEKVQLCAQALLLREHGFICDTGVIYFTGRNRRPPKDPINAMLSTGEVKPSDFITAAGSCNLTDSGRKRFIAVFERRMIQEITHPIFGYRVSYRQLLEVQSRLLIRHILGEIPDYPNFVTR